MRQRPLNVDFTERRPQPAFGSMRQLFPVHRFYRTSAIACIRIDVPAFSYASILLNSGYGLRSDRCAGFFLCIDLPNFGHRLR
jgi:hypothetical protein